MTLSNSRRVQKLVGSLLRHPFHLARYFRYNLSRGLSPLRCGVPWWSFSAIDALQRFCSSGMHVFEYGTGGSTIFLASRCAKVTCVEDDSRWLNEVTHQLQERRLANVSIRLCPFDFAQPSAFADSSYLRSLDSCAYDIIVVDGQDVTFRERLACFARAEEHVKPGGMIVVDDSWRYTELRYRNRAERVEVCESTGPFRFGVTSTDLFYY